MATSPSRRRARDLLALPGEPGVLNAITDVAGIRVGHATLIEGSGPLCVGEGPVRTGVTVLRPLGDVWDAGVFAGISVLNGTGEVTGTHMVGEVGLLFGPIAITNTYSVGVVRDAILAWMRDQSRQEVMAHRSLPVVAETWDGALNDIGGCHVRAEHVRSALESAASGPVEEGNVGGGTGMMAYQFKGGIGTASRRCTVMGEGYTLGALVQANHGERRHLRALGTPVGERLTENMPGEAVRSEAGQESGSIIMVLATDAPLLPYQLQRLARRGAMGLARTGAIAGSGSGDFCIALSTAHAVQPTTTVKLRVEALSDRLINPLFEGAVESVEEAILNALLQAETMEGRDNRIVHGLDPDALLAAMKNR